MYMTNRSVFFDRLRDVRQMLLDIERLLYNLPDETTVYHHKQSRLVSWANLDMAWHHVYQAWSLLSGEEVEIVARQREE